MFNIKLIGIFAFTVFVLSESAFVEHVMKCGLKDEECHKKVLKSIFTELGENGASEYGIKAIDPFYIKKLPMSLPGVIGLDITDASITGLKNCYFEKLKLDMDTKLVDGTLTCPNVVATGKYEITSSELIKNLLGKDVTGKGTGSIESEKVNIGIYLPFKVVKREDNLYFQPIGKSTTYTFEIVGNAKFNADNIKIGDEDATKMVLDLMNQNGKMITTVFVNFLSETASKIIDDEINLILNGIPMNTVLNDLSE